MCSQCGILILSCDNNISVLNIFFRFFKENWCSCEMPIYIGLEKKKVRVEGCEVLLSDEKHWAKRIKDYLRKIPTPNVLVILDDFIIEEKVDNNKINEFCQIMVDNPDVVNISLADIYDKKNRKTEFTNLMQRKRTGEYLVNMQVGIWNKEILLSLLRDAESPWQTELYGSIRARKLKNKRFLCLDNDIHMPIKYNRGWLIVRGTWNANEIKRLKLENDTENIFDGKNIMYFNYDHIPISLSDRIIRRAHISIRQALSWIGIYL